VNTVILLEEASAARFEIDHIQPRSLGGLDILANLALACQRCNSYRYNFTEAIDPESQVSRPLFNPCLQQWNEDFTWMEGGSVIRGKSSIGRATCDRLDLNDQKHDEGAIVKARRFWIQGGWHPPSNDTIES
jgi:hypothetical protein